MTTPAPPWALLAELTHACPLHCGYCSNPLELTRRSTELSTQRWAEVFRQAAAMGVLHTHLSGGEPLLREDLDALTRAAVDAGLYTQLVTSGVGLSTSRLDDLVDAGLHSVQLSVQHADPPLSDTIAGRASFRNKEAAAQLVKQRRLPLGINVVLHRHNLDALDDLLQLAVAWQADRIELANTQFYGWGLLNRAALMPSHEQLADAAATVARWRQRTDIELDITWVEPDYFTGVPKPCMGGWGAVSLTVTPDGTVLPCPAAASVPGLDAPNVLEHPLPWIWNESPAFNRYRGTDWMPSPCRDCAHKNEDFGGCRCQAFALTGDASRTDPACSLAPDHDVITSLASADSASAEVVRRRPTRRSTSTVGG
ncbi:pyrroloquinoline quinone biosynthesis protein PqqE [Streptomyces longispororuber]|uniref:pyrroloquinoline quinone biosynthesis protein PqqE n=1 Tax=Streptomyces longispororuber TaxID=68230 RepID=UPI00210A2B2F|nr:pyrroloquinoline quinone biosynthesis protein PqqE [Streptomyces longispororuber]MCQ4209426.1 pyrroloquinoline quinone biosynthesis protein PqqE [Streptomyces longispororuber]